jgi:phosphomannomutase
LTKLIKELGLNAIIINKEPDGNFPNHNPDQTKKENLVQLQKEVKKNNADIGIIFDGDADRVGFVDEKGEIVRIDLAFVLLAKDLIDKKIVKKPKIIYDLRLSRYISEFLKDSKTDYEILRVGNPFYKKKMSENKNIVLAGELSGHLMFSENHNIDDGIFAGLRMIEILSNEKKKFSELVKMHDKYYSSGEISLPVKNAKKILEILKRSFTGEIENIDGVTITTDRFWFNVRPSNTEPMIRLIAEGCKKSEVESLVKKIKDIIDKNDKM